MVRGASDRLALARRTRLEVEGLENREVPSAVTMCEVEGSFRAIAGGPEAATASANRDVPNLAGIDTSVLDFVFANAAADEFVR
jgi:hypothetical protein